MDLDGVNLCELAKCPDAEIAKIMRKFNFEKYKTLVRMHLSFELDLNTDEFDLPCHEIAYEDKGKLKKWNRLSKKQKHITSSACASAGNSPTDGLQQQIDAGFLYHLEELKDFLLLEKNVTQEGLFRKTGSVSRQNELRLQIQNHKPLNLEASGYSAHDCATVFKSYLSELPEPLLTDAHYPAHLQIAPLCISTSMGTLCSATRPPNPERLKREQHLLNSMQLLLLLLPDENRQLLQEVIEMLHTVATHEHVNKMSPENLATLFAPHLICPRNLPPEALHYVAKKMSSVIAYMVRRGMEIFDVPAKLSTDIRAYFHERKRKKTMSPEQTLDESISDMSTVNTVYTFVDREKTAAAHTANNTDTELAQLYAHIQSLPESSKKRRLIKQFNKQNGQGTPLQLVVMNRLKNSEASRSAKSISDSIKKHIFHKGIISRTPKRTTTALPPTLTTIETPNCSNTKNPKLRVLFQSPMPGHGTTSGAAIDTTPTVAARAVTPTTPLTSSTSSTTTARTLGDTNKAFNIKTHPLQKSISSSSLHMTSSTSLRSLHTQVAIDTIDSSACSSSDGYAPPICVSAPVSRQVSCDLQANLCTESSSSSSTTSLPVTANMAAAADFQLYTDDCATPLKVGDKKTVAWDEQQLLAFQHGDTDSTDSCNTPLQLQQKIKELKSRYKSEPNLSRIMAKDKLHEATAQPHELATHSKGSKSLTRKLMKGVSMSNLKFPFSTPETTKRLVRSVSSTLKQRRSSEDARQHEEDVETGVAPLLEDVDDVDLDDENFEDDPDDHVSSSNGSGSTSCSTSDVDEADSASVDENLVEGDAAGSSNELPGYSGARYQKLLFKQQCGVYRRNLESLTSTPSLVLGRRSMSPITKSAQRMPKAMQESIMTPRSRKPVMVLTTTLGSSDQNQTICQTDLSGFREQDEEDSPLSGKAVLQHQPPNLDDEDASSNGSYAEILHHKQRLMKATDEQRDGNALTNNFKEYLLSRSVLTASPVDSSFSSQPDDFASTHDIEDFDESQLSPSLLYCLDGNQPEANENVSPKTRNSTRTPNAGQCSDFNVATTSHSSYSGNIGHNRLATNPFVILNNARKRAATNELHKITTTTTTTTTTARKDNASSQSDARNKENCELVIEEYCRSNKKVLISDFPGETSF